MMSSTRLPGPTRRAPSSACRSSMPIEQELFLPSSEVKIRASQVSITSSTFRTAPGCSSVTPRTWWAIWSSNYRAVLCIELCRAGLRLDRQALISSHPDSELPMRRILFFGLLLSLAPLSSARAQNACADLSKYFSRPPKIGEWAELSWTKEGKPDPEQMRISVVGSEQRDAKRMYWFQVVMNKGMGGKRTIVQMLTPWDESSLQGNRAKEMIMKM